MARFELVDDNAGRFVPVDDEPTFAQQMVKRETSDLSSNLRRGVRDVIDTGAEYLAAGFDKLAGTKEADRVRAMNKQAKDEYDAANSGQILPAIQRVGGNILGTLPATTALGAGVGALGAPGLGAAISSGGMSTGRAMGPVADMATRMVGSGINGYVSAGLVDPAGANTGGVIGVVTPPVLRGMQAGMRAGGNLLRNAAIPADVRLSRDVAGIAGANTGNLDELAAMRDALRQQGPSLIPGAGQTAAEILQMPGASQLQRSIKAAVPAAFAEREASQSAARLAALDRVAPVTGTLADTADEVGTAISSYAIPQRDAAKRAVSAKFSAVDPFNESRINLPIDQMQAAKDKFLGPGNFGSGGSAQQAINEAQRIGTVDLPAIRAQAVGREPQSLVQAVRSMGGINPLSPGGMSGEITELGRRQTGTTGLVSGKGKTIDRVAEAMHERGFLPDPDPSTLLNAIRGNLAGEAHYAADVGDNAFKGALERSMGDAPGAARMLKPVPFEELQNLRSSIGEQWRAATRQGNAREAAALISQQRAIDDALTGLAAGRGAPGEYFDTGMASAYKDARSAHAQRVQRFDTGPQSSMFRTGRDGEAMAQGAEIPRKFFNGSPSQVQDAQSFARLVQNDPQMMGELKRYAMTDAAGQADRFGNLTNHKFNKWLDSRSGALGQITNEQDRATLKAIADSLRKSDAAESLGRSTNSDTAQKIASMTRLGFLDSGAANLVAGRIPGGRMGLDFLRGPARTMRAERIGGLLTDPERLGGLLDQFIATQQPRPQGLLTSTINPLMYRSAPLLYSPAGSGGGS